MLRLNTFGGLNLSTTGRALTGSALHRKRLTLLAVLAAHGERGISREKLVGLLWSEMPEERARHALAQALYAIKRDLSRELVRGSIQLTLNSAVIACDAVEFEQAMSERDWQRAVDLYTGPFLDGVYVDGADEYERWREEQRGRYERLVARALQELAAGSAADATRHIGYLQRWAAIEPLNTEVATRLIAALAAAGDSGSALQHALLHEQRLRTELGASSPPLLREAVAAIRAESSKPLASAPLTPDSTLELPIPLPVKARVGRRPLLAAAIPLTIAGAAAIWFGGASRATPTDSFRRVAIFPFTTSGSADLAFLGAGMVDLVSGVVDGAADLRATDPRAILQRPRPSGVSESRALARAAGADYFVLGSVVPIDDKVRVSASVYSTGNGGDAEDQVVAECARSALTRCVNSLSGAIVRTLVGPGAVRMIREAANETTSAEALRNYVEGENAMRRADYAAAVDAFMRATQADSAFALAHYRLSIAADWADRFDLIPIATAAARRMADRLSVRERQLLEAIVEYRSGNADRAELIYRNVLRGYPDDVEAWTQLGEVLFHANPSRGRSVVEARQAFERVITLDPGASDATRHLLRIVAAAGDSAAVRRIADRILVGEARPGSIDVRALRDFGTGSDADRRRFLQDYRQASSDEIYVAVTRLAVYSHDFEGAANIAGLLTASGRTPDDRAIGHVMRAYLRAAAGNYDAAERELAAARQHWPEQAALAAAYLALAPASLRTADAAARAAALLNEWPATRVRGINRYHIGQGPDYLWRRYYQALLAARREDWTTFESALKQVRVAIATSHNVPDTTRLELSLQAHAAARRGDTTRALTLLQHGRATAWPAYTLDRWLHAELLAARGQTQEAARLFRSFDQTSFETLPFAASGANRSELRHD